MRTTTGVQARAHSVLSLAARLNNERLGVVDEQKTSIDMAESILDHMASLRLPIDTPPPDSLEGYARQIWVDLLESAGPDHFYTGEVFMIEEYCWTKAQIYLYRRMMSDIITQDDTKVLRGLQAALITMNRMLRLSGTPSSESISEMRFKLAKDKALMESQARIGKMGGADADTQSSREGLLYGS